MKIPRFLPLFLLFLAGAGPGTALAAKSAPATGTQVDRVVAVSRDTITIKTQSKGGPKVTDIDIDGNRTVEKPGNVLVFHVSSMTEITVDGLSSKLSDVRAGMEVIVNAGMTPTDADSIVAYTVPPPIEKASPAPKGKGKQPKEAFRKISVDKVLAIQPGRITVGQTGAMHATAYLITPVTAITVRGKSATVSDIRPGMRVHVEVGAPSTAASIAATDEPFD
jgi:hypothetical protein